MYNQEILSKWLAGDSNINKKLISYIYEKNDRVFDRKKNLTNILPEVFVEINNADEVLPEIKKELIRKVQEIKDKDNDFKIYYFKDKLNLLNEQEKKIILDDIAQIIGYDMLNKKIDYHDLYGLLFYVKECGGTQEISEILASYTIFFARKYMIRELALCAIILSYCNDITPDKYFLDVKSFLETHQTSAGYFGYQDPFLKQVDNLDTNILNTFYSLWALDRIYDLLDEDVEEIN